MFDRSQYRVSHEEFVEISELAGYSDQYSILSNEYADIYLAGRYDTVAPVIGVTKFTSSKFENFHNMLLKAEQRILFERWIGDEEDEQ